MHCMWQCTLVRHDKSLAVQRMYTFFCKYNNSSGRGEGQRGEGVNERKHAYTYLLSLSLSAWAVGNVFLSAREGDVATRRALSPQGLWKREESNREVRAANGPSPSQRHCRGVAFRADTCVRGGGGCNCKHPSRSLARIDVPGRHICFRLCCLQCRSKSVNGPSIPCGIELTDIV